MHGEKEVMTLMNAGFCISSRDESEKTSDTEMMESGSFEVKKFDLTLAKGEILAVCGPVASGKVSWVYVLSFIISSNPPNAVLAFFIITIR
jgi:energy-coupling factor transporter ATP-binding protein EcfA2